MFSSDIIFRQQENLVDNHGNVRLDSGHYMQQNTSLLCCAAFLHKLGMPLVKTIHAESSFSGVSLL